MFNEVIEGKGFYISYCEDTRIFGLSFSGDGIGEETALVKELNGDKRVYILNGDFRKQYKTVMKKGFKACMNIYKKYEKESKSSWSNL